MFKMYISAEWQDFKQYQKIFIVIEFKAKHSDDTLINLLKNHLLINNTGKNYTMTYSGLNFNFFNFYRTKYFQNVPLCRVARLQTAFQR